MLLNKCWIVRAEGRRRRNDSQYSARETCGSPKSSGALLQAEALGADGKLARPLQSHLPATRSGNGLWILKQDAHRGPRLRSAAALRDRTPTYLEIERGQRAEFGGLRRAFRRLNCARAAGVDSVDALNRCANGGRRGSSFASHSRWDLGRNLARFDLAATTPRTRSCS